MQQFFTLVDKGGPVVVILLGLSVIALAIVLIKTYQFIVSQIRSRSFVESALDHLRSGEEDKALDMLEARRSPLAKVMSSAIHGLTAKSLSENGVREEVSRVGSQEIANLESHFRSLETIANISPLLGLLGTVIGMIQAFSQLSTATHVDPSQLSGGIWAALLTTAVGLSVAIPTLTALNGLEAETDRLRRDMGDAVTRIFTLHGESTQEGASLVTGRSASVPSVSLAKNSAV